MPDKSAELVAIGVYGGEFQAGVVLANLEEGGIEARMVTGKEALTGVFGAMGNRPTSVMVRAEDEERAREILKNRREESVDLDWDEIDVGEPADELAGRISRGEPTGAWVLPWFASLGVVALGFVFMLAGWPLVAATLWILVGIDTLRSWRRRKRYRRAARD